MHAVHRSRWTSFTLALASLLSLSACGGGGGGDSPTGSTGTKIGASGGTVTLLSGAVGLTVPSGALAADVTITAQHTTTYPSALTALASTITQMGPDGTQFATPATLTLGYASTAIPATVDEAELRLFKVVGSAWQLIAGSIVNAQSHSVSGSISSFSTYGVLGLPVATVTLAASGSTTINVGSTITLTPTAKASDGTTLSSKHTATWSTSSQSVAIVDIAGHVTGAGAGTATITATVDGVTATMDVIVNDPIVSVSVTPGAPAISTGGTVQLTATAKGFNGNTIAGAPAATWQTSNANIASVNQSGLVTGASSGSVTITATIAGISGTATVAVSLNLSAYAGTWTGAWQNTTFGSNGSATLVVSFPTTATISLTLTLTGNVFGSSTAPPPATLTGTIDANGGFSASQTGTFFGNLTLSGNATAFTGTGLNVPNNNAGVNRVDITGSVPSSAVMNWNYTLKNAGGGQIAVGVINLHKP